MAEELSFFGILQKLKDNYIQDTPKRVKIIDLFLVYSFATALIQFIYCAVLGRFPFNSFLAGFFSCIGFFVLTVSLRKQINPKTAKDFGIVQERAFADYVLCCIVLFFVAILFIG